MLHPTEYAARTYQDGKGVGLYYGELFVPGSGDWFSFPRINLAGIDRMRLQVWQNGTGATVTVRAGAPDGPVVARFTKLKDSGPKKDENGRPDRYEQYEAKIVDPKGLHDLFFVTEWPSGQPAPEVFIGEFSFHRSGG